MSMRARFRGTTWLKRVFSIGAVAVALGAVGGISIAIWGSWWRIDRFPTPEEWSALWGLATLAAAIVAAWLALAQLRQNSRAAEEQSRPFIIVDLHFRSTMVSIEVKNSGLTAATDIQLNWSAVPTIADTRRKEAFERHLVDEAIPFLAPGRSIRYLIGTFSSYPADADRIFHIRASYFGPDGQRRWDSESILDLDQWAQALADSDYDNKNWNEARRQTKAQQDTADAAKKAADALASLSDFIELQPKMKELRRDEEEAWERSYEPVEELIGPAIDAGDQDDVRPAPPGL